ncbi:hypothetical protein ACWT_5820 [Actinoplanes sp. SE50]|uniref:hypothetical protein n=1 Tax=unclassified Actinoplanes TaxID=2626549 RepID=UPI00023EBC17|nr:MULTISPECIES: hypothetical protein [unclassified Actinoplanes]AEV86838.1 hypothetical protein ACPL_5951 [Actinoplanes sp. SE50/110]ATO85235.1 hypothetical protein ACWT_5820 [Actinoplanes sp. SE50]SLM02645.1 hypothetical protein ACSP50_5927 [Actinoplanes sp. SE50/110]
MPTQYERAVISAGTRYEAGVITDAQAVHEIRQAAYTAGSDATVATATHTPTNWRELAGLNQSAVDGPSNGETVRMLA